MEQNCQWWCTGERSRRYHDEEWGIPVHGDRQHFEDLSLELLQCGLNWNLILGKRELFRQVFAGFDPEILADWGDAEVARALETPGMIRSERKIRAILANARGFREIAGEYGSFDAYIWSFTGGVTWVYPEHIGGPPIAKNGLSDTVVRDLKKRGFRHLGSVTVYSYLQACGIINDHAPDCPVYREIARRGPMKTVPGM